MDTHPITKQPIRPAGPDAAVTAAGLVCRYGDHTAVDGVDLEVHRGRITALLGTNGAGKTTSLEVLEGHRAPDAGQVRVLGADPRRARRRLAGRVGVMLQAAGAPDDLTAGELLALTVRLTPDRGPVDLDAVLAEVELGHRADVRCHQLSGGERRRLDLAAAIAGGPEVLFCDEPTTGMDPEARERTWATLQRLRDGGTAILLTTHYLEEAEALADHVAIMHQGRIAVSGTLDDLRAAEPATIAVRLPHERGEALPPLRGRMTVERRGPDVDVVVMTEHLTDDLAELCGWARSTSTPLTGLRAAEASLAELFRRVAGDQATITTEDDR